MRYTGHCLVPLSATLYPVQYVSLYSMGNRQYIVLLLSGVHLAVITLG